MAGSILTSQRALPVVLTVTLALSLLPGNGMGVAAFLSEVVGIVFTPFAELGNDLGSRLRTPPRSRDLPEHMDEAFVQHLQDEMVEYERLYRAEQAKVEELLRQIDQLQKVPTEYLRTPLRIMTANVAMRSPTSALGTVLLNRGERQGVRPGTIAVYEGVHLVGRVTQDVRAVQCTLLPLGNPDTGLISARIVARDQPTAPITGAPDIQLEPDGRGAFIGQVDREKVIQPGDEVILLDSGWPASAQAMRIGTVTSVAPNDSQPLRNMVVVTPEFQVSQLQQVILKIETDEGAAGGDSP